MDRRQLAYFVAIVDTGGFTRAARLVGTSQPTMSTTLRRLEGELGGPLFVRDHRTVGLTIAGEAFLPYARRMLLALDEARSAVTDSDAEPRGELRVGSIIAPVGFNIFRFVADFQRAHPLVKTRLITRRTPEELIEDVRYGRLDVAVSRTLTPDAPPPDVEFVALQSEPFLLQVAPDHRLADRTTVSIDDVRDEPFVCFPADNAQRLGMDRIFERIGLTPNVAFECDAPAHLRLVLDADVCCLGLLHPTVVIEPDIRNIPFDVEMPRATVILVFPNRIRRSRPARAWADALVRALEH